MFSLEIIPLAVVIGLLCVLFSGQVQGLNITRLTSPCWTNLHLFNVGMTGNISLAANKRLLGCVQQSLRFSSQGP